MKSGNNLIFATAVYGTDYLRFMVPHLWSVQQQHPGTQELVLWQDLPERAVDLLSHAFPNCRFIKVEQPIAGGLHQKIARKMHFWRQASELHPESDICLIDCDTLVVRPITPFLEDDYDVLFTWKDSGYPINTGVVITRAFAQRTHFLKTWADLTETIVADAPSLELALAESGAGDQHALRQFLDASSYEGTFSRRVGGHEVRLKGIPCAVLNQTNCASIDVGTHIIHYKSGWHNILLKNADFTQHRPESECREMYDYWQSRAAAAGQYVARELTIPSTRRHLDRFIGLHADYQARGILHSEMLAICSICRDLGVELVIESGRARGQSTYVLATFFQESGVRIISIDWDQAGFFNAEDDDFARLRLQPFEHVSLLYGDANRLIPDLLREHAGKRIAILLDGPKGQTAIDLVLQSFRESTDVMAAFIHDTMKGTPQRDTLESTVQSIFFTDDPDYVELHSKIDEPCVEIGHWRPYWNKDYGQLISYGPTLAVIFPLVAVTPPPAEDSLQDRSERFLQAARELAGRIRRRFRSKPRS